MTALTPVSELTLAGRLGIAVLLGATTGLDREYSHKDMAKKHVKRDIAIAQPLRVSRRWVTTFHNS